MQIIPTPPRLQPAFYGGLFIGVLSALPIINAGNCVCCMWVIGGGMLAAYLMQQNYPYQVSAADGALVGLLAGVFGGVIGTIISVPLEMAMGPYTQRILQRLIESNPDFPAEARQAIENMGSRGVSAIRIIAGLCFGVIIGGLFAMLGGLLGVAIFKKNLPPPPPPAGRVDVLPPQ
jgi:hypothetical protein